MPRPPMVILEHLWTAVAAVAKSKSFAYVTNDAFVDVALISNVAVAVRASWVDQLDKIKTTAMPPGPNSSHKTIRIGAPIMSPCANAIGSVVLFSYNIHSNFL